MLLCDLPFSFKIVQFRGQHWKGLGLRRVERKSTSICLVPWRLKCLENGKHDFCERSTCIAKWTMETFSVDAKDAGNGEREKRFFFFCLSRDTYQNRSNRSRIAHESARTRLSTRQLTQVLMSRIVVFDLCVSSCNDHNNHHLQSLGSLSPAARH